MRSAPFSMMAGILAVGLSGGGWAGESYPHEKTGNPKPAPRVPTEADNTRLREAAERRFRKAQRQARGMPSGTTALASASQSARPNDRAHDEPIPSAPTTTPDSLGDVMGGEP